MGTTCGRSLGRPPNLILMLFLLIYIVGLIIQRTQMCTSTKGWKLSLTFEAFYATIKMIRRFLFFIHPRPCIDLSWNWEFMSSILFKPQLSFDFFFCVSSLNPMEEDREERDDSSNATLTKKLLPILSLRPETSWKRLTMRANTVLLESF